MQRSTRRRRAESAAARAVAALCTLIALEAAAGGRLLATGGATMLEGAAGGGIVPWAVMSGTSARSEHGPTVAQTFVDSGDYTLTNFNASYSISNRVELSFARQSLDIGVLSGALGFDPGDLEQDIFGVKLRLFGDALYSSGPQVSLGLLHKENRQFLIPGAVGAARDADTEWYLAATKIFLARPFGHNSLVNLTLRESRANQLGLLGFGGDLSDERDWLAEISVASFLNSHWAVGFEYREKPSNLGFAPEDDWRDVFVAYFHNKRFAVVLARAELGSIAGVADQDATYISFQGSFR